MARTGWHFKKRERSDEAADPIQGEFFDEVPDPGERRRGAAAALVREAIQNSLDAGAGDGPVRVRFYVSEEAGLPAEAARKWFEELWPHLRARRSGMREVPGEPGACRFVLVEDFNTKGLEGDPRRGTTPDEGERDDFFAFYRADGVSGKAGQEGGRWGVGKSVFNRASRINTFLALSVRKSDRTAHLIGRCFLLTHKINAEEYQPYGRYGRIEDDGFTLPVEEKGVLDDFRRDFGLQRELDTPGLSVVVPYANEEITVDAIRSAVVREYFWPILTRRLTVETSAAEHHTLPLDPDTLLDCATEEAQGELGHELRALIEFAFEARTSPASPINLHQPGEPPRWGNSLFPDGVLNELAGRYQRGELLIFRIPLVVRKCDGTRQDSYFLVYVRLDRNGQGYPPVFVRGGLIIPKARERRLRGHRVHALVVIDEEGLSSMLGDAETPAHTHWSTDSRNFRNKYKDGAAVINFVRGAATQIVEILSGAREERDWLALADFFPELPEDEGLLEEDSGSGEGSKSAPPPRPAASTAPQPYRIEHVRGGFRIVRDNRSCTRRPVGLRIEVAYDTTRGSPLKKYDPLDFDLSQPPVRVGVKAAEVVECRDNLLRVRLDDDGFEIHVRGFDENRDLYVNAEPVDDAERLGYEWGRPLRESEAQT